MGYPPLVTPYSQYVKNVAIVNVLNSIKGKERWSLIDDNTWDMLLGKSGKLPGPVGDEIIKLSKKLSKDFYTGNPQDLVSDVLDQNRKEMKSNNWELGEDDEELLEFSLHKNQYIDYKSGDALKKLRSDIDLKKHESLTMEKGSAMKKKEIITINESNYEVEFIINEEIHNSNGKSLIKGNKILSPIEGKVFLTKDSNEKGVKVGDVIKKGDVICYIESMKVINAIKSEFSGKIEQICIKDGEDIYDDDILFIIN